MSSDARFRDVAPWLLAVAPLVLLIEGGAYALAIGVGVAAGQVTHLPDLAAVVFGLSVTLVATTPLRRRGLTPVREWIRNPSDGDASIRGLIAHVRERRAGWWRREATLAAVGGLSWIVTTGVAVAALTGWQYRRYAGGATETTHPAATLMVLLLCGVLAAVVAAATGAVTPANGGLLNAVAAVRAAPRAFTRHALVESVRATTAGVVATVGATTAEEVVGTALWELSLGGPSGPQTTADYWAVAEPATLLLAVGVPVVVAMLGRVGSLAVLRPSADVSIAAERPDARVVAVAVLLLTASMVGTAAVRVDDTGYPGTEIEPSPERPSAALEVAQSNTFTQRYRRVVTEQQVHEGERWESSTAVGVDPEDRQYRYAWNLQDGNTSMETFFGEGVRASRGASTPQVSSEETSILRWRGGNWSAFATVPGAFRFEVHVEDTPSPDAPWRVVAENETALVVGVDGDAVAAATEEVPSEAEVDIAANSSVRVVIDRDRGTLRATRVNATYVDHFDGERQEYHWEVSRRYEHVGTHDVERPDALGPRRPVEWVWDVLYY